VVVVGRKGTKSDVQNKMDKVVVVSYKNDNQVAVVGKPVFTTVMVPPIFNDIENGWAKYLERTLDRDLLKRKKAPVGQYTIKVNFEVDQEGNVINVKALNDAGYGTAEEAVRIIESSPKWKPAIQNGSTVKYALNQEVVFMFLDK
jgi:protein TonB